MLTGCWGRLGSVTSYTAHLPSGSSAGYGYVSFRTITTPAWTRTSKIKKILQLFLVPRPSSHEITSIVFSNEYGQRTVGVERLVGTQRRHAKSASVRAGQYDVIFNSEEIKTVTIIPVKWIKVYHWRDGPVKGSMRWARVIINASVAALRNNGVNRCKLKSYVIRNGTLRYHRVNAFCSLKDAGRTAALLKSEAIECTWCKIK